MGTGEITYRAIDQAGDLDKTVYTDGRVYVPTTIMGNLQYTEQLHNFFGRKPPLGP